MADNPPFQISAFQSIKNINFGSFYLVIASEGDWLAAANSFGSGATVTIIPLGILAASVEITASVTSFAQQDVGTGGVEFTTEQFSVAFPQIEGQGILNYTMDQASGSQTVVGVTPKKGPYTLTADDIGDILIVSNFDITGNFPGAFTGAVWVALMQNKGAYKKGAVVDATDTNAWGGLVLADPNSTGTVVDVAATSPAESASGVATVDTVKKTIAFSG